MRRPISLSFLSALLAVFVFQYAVFSKDEWTQVQSKNFHFIGNTGEKEIKQVAVKLEQFREVFRRLFPKMVFNPSVPTIGIVFKNDSAFKPFKPLRENGKIDDFVSGYFQSGQDVNYIALAAEKGNSTTFRTIFHEYVHDLVENELGFANVPPWFNEGLAEYYETFTVENEQKFYLGSLNSDHLALLSKEKLIPFETFFNIDYPTWQRNGHDSRNTLYAQSWAFMHFLMQGSSGERKPQLNEFLSLLLKNTPPKEAFQKAFKTDYATMEIELQQYIAQRSFIISVITFQEKLTFETEMTVTPLSEAEANAYLGNLLFHSRRLDAAETYVNQAIALNPNVSLAYITKGLIKLKQNNFVEARQHLEKAIAVDGNNYLALYHYAYILSRENMSPTGIVFNYPKNNVALMRDALKKSIALNPNFAESYYLLSFVNLVQNEQLDESLGLMKKALTLSPGNPIFLFIIAQFYIQKDDFNAAQTIAENLAASASRPEQSESAKYLLNKIKNRKTQLEQQERFKKQIEQTGQTAVITPEEELPLDEKLIAEQQKAAFNESLNRSLRKPEAGEQRVLAFFTEIACDAKGLTFIFRTDSKQILKLTATSFKEIQMITFSPDASRQQEITCGKFKQEMFGVVTYRPSNDAQAKYNGKLVLIEFVPKDFKLLD
jgi:tetratricopeptide (TPR) repeat protein